MVEGLTVPGFIHGFGASAKPEEHTPVKDFVNIHSCRGVEQWRTHERISNSRPNANALRRGGYGAQEDIAITVKEVPGLRRVQTRGLGVSRQLYRLHHIPGYQD